MSACKYNNEKHNWIKLLGIGSTDYSPGSSAWWCTECGRAATQDDYDNRNYNIWERDPAIHKQLNTKIKTV